jgi:hypothetical protein
MLTAPDWLISGSPTTWTGASEVMFGEAMREPVTTMVSGAPASVSCLPCAAVSAGFSCVDHVGSQLAREKLWIRLSRPYSHTRGDRVAEADDRLAGRV